MIKADKIMYKACPSEKCNKSVVDEGNGNYRCEKCAQSFNNFDWRYILRVAIADVTDYEVIISIYFFRFRYFSYIFKKLVSLFLHLSSTIVIIIQA